MGRCGSRMALHQASGSASGWTTRERILGELLSHGIAVPDLEPSARFVAIARVATDYRPIARSFPLLEPALRWLQQMESNNAIMDVIVDLSAPSLGTAVIRPFHVLTADNAREPLDLGMPVGSAAASLSSPRAAAHARPVRRRAGAPRPID